MTTTKIDVNDLSNAEQAGLVVMGLDYASLTISGPEQQRELALNICKDADQGNRESVIERVPLAGQTIWLRVEVKPNASRHFTYSLDGNTYQPIGKPFQAARRQMDRRQSRIVLREPRFPIAIRPRRL